MRVYGYTLQIEDGKVYGAWWDDEKGSERFGIPYRKCWRYSYGKRYEDGWDNAWGRYTPAQARRKIYNGTLNFF